MAAYLALVAIVIGASCVATEAGLCGYDVLKWARLSYRQQCDLRRRYIPWQTARLISNLRLAAAAVAASCALWVITHPS